MFDQPSIGYDEAQRALDAVFAALTADDSPAAIAVVDAHGDLVACARQDGAPTRMLRRARAKAYTAARTWMDTVAFRDDVLKAEGRTLDDWGDPGMTSLQGGLAVRRDGRILGGIALSGNTTERDEGLARIGLEAMGISYREERKER